MVCVRAHGAYIVDHDSSQPLQLACIDLEEGNALHKCFPTMTWRASRHLDKLNRFRLRLSYTDRADYELSQLYTAQ